MKRKSIERDLGARYANVVANFSRAQLEEIGKVSMTFNDVERAVHELFASALNLAFDCEVVASRINGLDGVVAIIKESAHHHASFLELSFRRSFLEIDVSLDAFIEVKKIRDGVIHANVLNPNSVIGIQYGRRKSRNDILLTTDALSWVWNTSVLLSQEIRGWSTVFKIVLELEDVTNDPESRERFLYLFSELIVSIRKFQTLRKQLKKPGFPKA